VIIGKLTRGIDIRDYGSGNIGASNVLRTLGLGPALLVMFFDTIKGFGAVLLCKQLHLGPIVEPYVVLAGGLLSVAGHSFSVFLHFKGGKGVATSLGVIFGLNATIALIALGLWLALVASVRIISVASIVATLSVPAQMLLWKSMDVPRPYQVFACLAAAGIVLKHVPNMKRLAKGTEPRVGHRISISGEGHDESELSNG
jgi:glycerol-3-phosphate acyltransferase PlsY